MNNITTLFIKILKSKNLKQSKKNTKICYNYFLNIQNELKNKPDKSYNVKKVIEINEYVIQELYNCINVYNSKELIDNTINKLINVITDDSNFKEPLLIIKDTFNDIQNIEDIEEIKLKISELLDIFSKTYETMIKDTRENIINTDLYKQLLNINKYVIDELNKCLKNDDIINIKNQIKIINEYLVNNDFYNNKSFV